MERMSRVKNSITGCVEAHAGVYISCKGEGNVAFDAGFRGPVANRRDELGPLAGASTSQEVNDFQVFRGMHPGVVDWQGGVRLQVSSVSFPCATQRPRNFHLTLSPGVTGLFRVLLMRGVVATDSPFVLSSSLLSVFNSLHLQRRELSGFLFILAIGDASTVQGCEGK